MDAENSRRLPSHHGWYVPRRAVLVSSRMDVLRFGWGVVGIFVQMLLQMRMCVWCLSCALVEGEKVASPCS